MYKWKRQTLKCHISKTCYSIFKILVPKYAHWNEESKFEKYFYPAPHWKKLFAKNMYFGHKKWQKYGCHGQKAEYFSNAHIYSPIQDFLVSFIFSISGFVWLESRLLDFGGGWGRMHTFGLFGPYGQGHSVALTKRPRIIWRHARFVQIMEEWSKYNSMQVEHTRYRWVLD